MELEQAIEKLIAAKKAFIDTIVDSIKIVRTIKEDLDKAIQNTNISRTVGSGVSILGTILLFTPLAPAGVALAAGGALTSAGASIAQAVIDGNKSKEVKDAVDKQIDAGENFLEVAANVLSNVDSVIKDSRSIAAKFRYAKTVRDVLRGFELVKAVEPGAAVAFNGLRGAQAIGRAGAFAAAKALGLGVLGGVTAVWDIVSAWTSDNDTSQKMQTLIDDLSTTLDREKEELQKLSLMKSDLNACSF